MIPKLSLSDDAHARSYTQPYCVLEAKRGPGLFQFKSNKIFSGRDLQGIQYANASSDFFGRPLTQSEWNSGVVSGSFRADTVVFEMGDQKNASPKILAISCTNPTGVITADQVREAAGSVLGFKNLDSIFQASGNSSKENISLAKADQSSAQASNASPTGSSVSAAK